MTFLRSIALGLLLTSLGSAAYPGPKSKAVKDPLNDFDLEVARAVRDWSAPGLAIAVIKDGKLLFSKGYGSRELGI